MYAKMVLASWLAPWDTRRFVHADALGAHRSTDAAATLAARSAERERDMARARDMARERDMARALGADNEI